MTEAPLTEPSTPSSDAGGPNPDPLLTIRAAAAYLACGEWLVRRLIRERELPAHRLGKNYVRLRVSDLEDWLERTRTEGSDVE